MFSICIIVNSSEEEEELKATPEDKSTWKDQVRMIHLRRFINELAEKVQQKEYALQKARFVDKVLHIICAVLCVVCIYGYTITDYPYYCISLLNNLIFL